MNRRERRAHWLAHHRGELAATGEARPPAMSRPESQLARHEARPAQSQFTAVRAETRHASRLANPAVGSLGLRIEEIVLHGFDPRGRYAVGDAVQQELARLLIERGAPSSLAATAATEIVERLDAGAFRAAPNARPQTLGAQVARAIYGGLKR
jgi:hypothetical protein